MRILWISLVCLLLPWAQACAGVPNLAKIHRKICKEPVYVAKPLYGLVVVGPEAATRVWLVLDKSKREATSYDVLYADLNGNGDLTESSEKFVRSGEGTRFQLPDFKDPVIEERPKPPGGSVVSSGQDDAAQAVLPDARHHGLEVGGLRQSAAGHDQQAIRQRAGQGTIGNV